MSHRQVASTFLFVLSIILSLSWLNPGTSSSAQVAEKSDGLEVDDEANLIRERARLYLQRHGDNERIDAERRLGRVRIEYQRRRIIEAEQSISQQAIPGTNWVSLGPTNGAGRAVAIAAHPTIPGTIYIGAADGGVWKTVDGGSSWIPLTDSLNDLSVGALAIAPSSPNTVYLGSGEGGYAIDFVPGIGFLKSTDGGDTWILPSSVIATKFYRILVHPTNAQQLVIGTNEGGFLSTDGGDTWRSVIDKARYQDVTDIQRHPANPQILYAATWDAFRWCERIGSCSTSSPVVLKSTDGGATWKEKKSGLAASTTTLRVNRPSIAISPSNPSVIYLSTSIFDINTNDEVSHIFKSTDAGDSWTDLASLASSTNSSISHFMGTQGWYDNTIVVSPNNENVVIAGGVRYVRSRDGGATWELPQFAPNSIHVDVHDLRYVGSRLYIANDGGIWSSPDDGNTATAHNTGLVTRQYYAMTNDPANRNRIFAGSQDNGTDRRPDGGGTAWTPVIGGDGFECAVNPAVSSIAYGTIQFGSLRRTKEAGVNGTPRFFDITPPYISGESGPFLSVLGIDPNRPSTLYTVSNRIWQTTNGGDSWEPLPTTTTDGSIWARDVFTISAFAMSRSDSLIMMAAKANLVNNSTVRNIFRTNNGGTTWVSATTGLPSSKGVNNLEIDPKNPNIAYAAMGGTTGVNVYQSLDGGASWSARGAGLPAFSAQVVRVDPTDANVLYCGTDVGVYRSTNQGASWERFGTGLPSSSVNDIQILDDASILRVATHGRGIWELEVPPSGNTPPTANISDPPATMTIAKGTTLNFSGSISDVDIGDSVTGTWTFPDTWETVPATSGLSVISHTFNAAGVFPVHLVVKDHRGALASASVTIRVPEPADSCSTPTVIPGEGPFPFSIKVNNEAAGTQTSDPAPSCVPNLGRSNTLWFEFTPPVSGGYEVSTCGSSVNTVLSLWSGPKCGPYTALSGGCNNDASAGSNCFGVGASNLTFSANAGQTLRAMVGGLSTSSVGAFTLTVRKTAQPDFSLSFSSPAVTADRGTKARIAILINRTGGFTGNVTLTVPASLPAGVKPKPPDPITTTDDSATFKLKIGGGVTPGAYQLTFTGRDDSGRVRAATVTLIVQ